MGLMPVTVSSKAAQNFRRPSVSVRDVCYVLLCLLLAAFLYPATRCRFQKQQEPSRNTSGAGLNFTFNSTVSITPLLHIHDTGEHPTHLTRRLLASNTPLLYTAFAFLDLRPMMFQKPAELILFMAAHLQASPAWLVCRLDLANGSRIHSPARFSYQYQNRGPNKYVAACYICPLNLTAEDLIGQHMLDGKATVVHSDHDPDPDPSSWRTVSVVPIIPSASQQLNPAFVASMNAQQYALGEGDMSVCTAPLRGELYYSTLVDWTEFAKLMGANMIYAYALQYNDQQQVEGLGHSLQLMAHYQARGEYTVHRWLFHRGLDLWYYGQTLALQHCLYNSMGRFRWMAVIDFDEYLVPRVPSALSWRQLIQWEAGQNYLNLLHMPESQLVQQAVFKVGYMFRNAYVCSRCRNSYQQRSLGDSCRPGSQLSCAFNFLTPTSFLPVETAPANITALLRPSGMVPSIIWGGVRTKGINACRRHSKYIADPYALRYSGIHYTAATPTWNTDSPLGTVRIPWHFNNYVCLEPEVGLMYHSRADDVVSEAALQERKATHLPEQHEGSFVYDSLKHCLVCDWQRPVVDYTVANRFGADLVAKVKEMRSGMHSHG